MYGFQMWKRKRTTITEEREYRPLERIRDGYSKYLLTMDKLPQKRSGVKHRNLVKFLENNSLFT